VTNTTGNVMEEVVCHVIRWESDLPPHLVGALEIPKAAIASLAAFAITVDDVAMDVNLVPLIGDARNPQATIFFPAGSTFELQEWFENAAEGEPDLRDITVDLGKEQNARRPSLMILYDCYPVDHHVVGSVMEEVRIKPIRFEMQ
jgi:hypothetical protein